MPLYQKNLKTNNFFEYFFKYKPRDDDASMCTAHYTPGVSLRERVYLHLRKLTLFRQSKPL